MDGERFDALTKRLAMGISRRGVFKALGGLGLATGALGVAQAAGATSLTGACHAFCQPQARQNRRTCYDACLACDGETDRICQSEDRFSCCETGTNCASGTCAPPPGQGSGAIGQPCSIDSECGSPANTCLGGVCVSRCFADDDCVGFGTNGVGCQFRFGSQAMGICGRLSGQECPDLACPYGQLCGTGSCIQPTEGA